jgi:hypothetical protein
MTAQTATHGATLPRVFTSELTKLRTVRSTYWALAAAFVLTVGFGALAAGIQAHDLRQESPQGQLADITRNGVDAVSAALSGVMFAQIVVGVLGVLAISSEYKSRAVRTTLWAVPQRGRLLAAKLGAIGLVALLVGQVTAWAAYGLNVRFYSGLPVTASLSDPGVLRAVVATGLYVALVGVAGLGLGAIIRHSAGAITALVGFLLVAPALVSALPSPWADRIGKFLPLSIGEQAATTGHLDHHLGPWAGLLVLAVCAGVAVAAGGWLLKRRDA